MAKQKVSELPKEEQEQLIKQAKEAGLRGIFTSWTVETLKSKIAAEAGALNEAQKLISAETAAETEETAPETETTDETEETESSEPKERQTAPAPAAKKAEKTYICHICRSKVINGVCTGCGFSVGRSRA